MRASIRNNAAAYAYSITVTCSFAAIAGRHGNGTPGEIFAFALGAALGFAVAEAAASRGFRDRIRPERSDVVVLGTAFAPLSVGASVGAAILASTWTSGWIAWASGAFVSSGVYVLLSGVEMALARHHQERHPPQRDE